MGGGSPVLHCVCKTSLINSFSGHKCPPLLPPALYEGSYKHNRELTIECLMRPLALHYRIMQTDFVVLPKAVKGMYKHRSCAESSGFLITICCKQPNQI